ncbi:MAG TPA: FtsQ-type POTRA domain-containing protein [Pseudolabrys sp.]|nr:FtsQ-type POTRA domain-containing protein [Pseudolabrys sp.]
MLLRLDIPPGVGSSAATLLLLASVGYGVLVGGHAPQFFENLQNLCDGAANRVGFRITEVAITGEHEVDRDRILLLAGISEHSSLVFLDAARARARLMSSPWIADATVLKLYPDRLRIEIRERRPFALWQKDGRIRLIADDGAVLEENVPARFSGLPLVVGAGADEAARDFLAILARYPAITRLTKSSVLVAERRWNLHLKGSVEVLLPQAQPAFALEKLIELDRTRKILSRDVVAIDLRLPDRVVVRQSESAAADREGALKENEKSKKLGRPRGGEA